MTAAFVWYQNTQILITRKKQLTRKTNEHFEVTSIYVCSPVCSSNINFKFKVLSIRLALIEKKKMGDYHPNDYIEFLVLYMRHQNARIAAEVFRQNHPGGRQPDERVIRDAVRRYENHGNPIPQRRRPNAGRPRGENYDDDHHRVIEFITANPRASTRDAANFLNIPQSNVSRHIRRDHLHPYHYTRVQSLKPRHYEPRLRFCRWILEMHREDENFVDRILFTDESSFGKTGSWNCHNNHFYARENPHLAIENRSDQDRFQPLNIWIGIVGDKLVSSSSIMFLCLV